MSKQLHVDKKFVNSLIRRLNHYCFVAGTNKYMRAHGLKSITPEYMSELSLEGKLEFATCASWSFKKAQRIIIDTRLALEDAEKTGTITFDSRYNKYYIYSLVTDYADCLAWIMLQQDISQVRNQYLEPKKHSPLREQNWESIEASLKFFNKDPHQFALSTDLTSFMHMGDIYCVNSKESTRGLVEVKTGRMNDRIMEALRKGPKDGMHNELFTIVKESQNPQKTAKQVSRVLNQFGRAMTTLTITDDKRTEAKSNKKITIQTDNRTEESWADDVRELLASMEEGRQNLATGWRDYGIFFMYGKKSLTNLDISFFRFRVNEHFKLGVPPELQESIPFFSVAGALGQGVIMPRSLLFMQKLGPVRQRKLLNGDEFLLVFLYPPAIGYLLKKHGYELTLKNAGGEDQQYASKFMSDLFGKNKMPVISHKSKGKNFSWTILPGTWQRIIFDFMAPIELVNYSESTRSSNNVEG